MTMTGFRPISTHAELLAASGDDPFVRWEVALDAELQAWALPDRGVAFVRATPSGRRQLAVVSGPEAALPVLRAHLDGTLVGPGPDRGFTVPQGTLALLGPDPRVGAGDDWEWMWTTSAPPEHPDVVALGPADHDEVAALLAAASPRHSATIEDDVVVWAGIREHGLLVACGAHSEHVPGVPHLASIAAHPQARGRGLGAAVTGTLTAWALRAGAPVVTLGMYSDNDVARRMYQRLGFTITHRWSSRRLVRP
jgi:ribosomal protein S18 acetylase RimI-like enzyme